jgi:hypothetical protein
MSVSGINSHTSPVPPPAARPPAARPETAKPAATAGKDSDGDNDGTKGTKVDAKA